MECNRDEAVRAREAAEKKFLVKDFKGAKKFAIRAQKLYPELDGISQLLRNLEVYICAEDEKTNGESNWYGVLGVTPLADDETIRKQYRKLALLLHPDKNKSIGAEGAFQLVSQAWSLLSDKSKKVLYDQRCSVTNQQMNRMKNDGPSVPPPPTNRMKNDGPSPPPPPPPPKNRMKNDDPSPPPPPPNKVKNDDPSRPPPPPQNGFYNFGNTAQAKVPKGNGMKNHPLSGSHAPRKKERKTFWTVCNRCKMQYEYLRMYLNHNLLCPNCHEAYFAVEISPPTTKSTKISSQTSNQQRKNINHQGSDAMRNNSATHFGASVFNHSNQSNPNDFQWVPFSESTSTQSAAQAAHVVKQAYEKVKRERQKEQVAARREEALRKKSLASKRTMGIESSRHFNIAKRRKGVEDCGTNNNHMSSGNGTHHDNLRRCMSKHGQIHHVDFKQLLMNKARDGIGKKLNDRTSATTARSSAPQEVPENITENETANVRDDSLVHGWTHNLDKKCDLVGTKSQALNCLNTEPVKQMMEVLDNDFHDFDRDRREECFRENQVWAVYDDDDGMPRRYALIHEVISLNPFKLRISLLSSVTHSRLGHVSWFLSGFSKTCGEFGIGRQEICNSVDIFSHSIRWMKRTSKSFEIYPRKGEIWALYRNWSLEWNELTEDEEVLKFDMVEVIEDYDEEFGVMVITLVKVAGFKAVFRKHLNPMEIRRIPNEEMSRFSHMVPSHLLSGGEGLKAAKGCRELDPAAMPLEMLEAISKIEQIEFTVDIEAVKVVVCDRLD